MRRPILVLAFGLTFLAGALASLLLIGAVALAGNLAMGGMMGAMGMSGAQMTQMMGQCQAHMQAPRSS